MTDDTTPGGQPPPEYQPDESEGTASTEHAAEEQQQGSIRYQDPSTATPRDPSVAEQRARRQALREQKEREAAEAQARQEAERKAETKRKVLIGSGVTVGLAGLVASWYLVAKPDEVSATCTDASGTIQPNDNYCDPEYVQQQGGHMTPGGLLILPMGMGGGSYHYNYGGTGTVGGKVSGGSFNKPSGNTNVTSKSGKSVQRGGFGISGKAGTGKSGGS